MREIKFRAWDKQERKMITGRLATSLDIFTQSYAYRSKDVELMQYTGLKDKNGVEIYEGDILSVYEIRSFVYAPKVREESYVTDVIWEDGGFMVKSAEVDYYDSPLAIWFNHENYINDLIEFEIIGNIYENEDLISNT